MRIDRAILAGIAAAFLLFAVPALAHAAPVHVGVFGSDASGDGSLGNPYRTVQFAVNMATAGDDVLVGAGEFVGNVAMKNGVSLYGTDGGLTTLRGTGSTSVVTINGLGAGETVADFVITGGVGSVGGGIYVRNSSPTIRDNVVIGNAAQGGGGIGSIDSSPIIRNNIVASNTATQSGAGIACYRGSPMISENGIANNTTVQVGGGMFVQDCVAAVIDGNTISGNVANGAAGGIYNYNSTATISDSAITSNTAVHASSSGGGIACWGANSATVVGNTITGNSANYGAGINASNSSPSITDNNISNNAASYGGGGINVENGTPTVADNTISENTAALGGGILTTAFMNITNNVIASNVVTTYYGGGIACFSASPNITNNTIVSNSSASSGGGVYGLSASPAIVNSIVRGNTPQDLSGCSATYSIVGTGVTAGTGNTTGAPSFVNAAGGDYRLVLGSVGIDIATSTAAPALDKQGVFRPQGAGVDMGAFEYFSAAAATPTDPVLSSLTHAEGVWSPDVAAVVDMTGATSTVAPIAGFAISVTENATEYPAPAIGHGAETTSHAFAAPGGTYYVNVATVDVLGNWSTGAHYGPIMVDSTDPAVADDAPIGWSAAETTVSVSAVETESGLVSIDWARLEPDGATSEGSSLANPLEFPVAAEGTTTIEYSAIDAAGNRCATQTALVRVDMSGPVSTSLSIDGGAVFTVSPDVTLQLGADDDLSGVDEMSLSEDGTFDTEPWEAFAAARSWTLTGGEGTRTVYARFRDLVGNESGTVTDEIVLDFSPTAVDDADSTDEDTLLLVPSPGVLTNDTDTQTPVTDSTLVSPPSSGELTLNADGSFSYLPDADFNGEDEFTYIATDGRSWSSQATCTITVNSVNDAPSSVALSDASVNENAGADAVVGTLSATDVDGGDTHTFSIVAGGDGASFNVLGDELRASASFDFETKSSYSVTVRATDSGAPAQSLDKTFTVAVVDQNDTPTDITVSATSIDENEPVGTEVCTLGTADVDSGDSHTYTIVGGADAADFDIVGDALNAATSFDYEFQSDLVVRVRTTDAGGAWYEEDLEFTVNDVNEAPEAADDSLSVDEDSWVNIAFADLLGNDSDPEDDALSVVLQDPASFGVLTPAVLSVDYTPAADFNGADEFTYLAFDGDLYSGVATVAITVDPVNDVPSFTAGAAVTVAEDSGAYSAAWASEISAGPANESEQELSFETTNTNQALFADQPEVAADGSLSFTPALDANGVATVVATLLDDDSAGGSALTTEHAFTITVTPVADETSLAVTSVSEVLPAFGAEYDFTGALSSKGVPVAGADVRLEYSYDGVAFSDATAMSTTTADGGFSIAVTPMRKTYYRARFAGEADEYLASESSQVVVTPRAGVGVVAAPATMYVGRASTVSGFLKPRHTAGTKPVRVYRYRYVSGSWKSYGYVLATASDYGSYSKYAASLALPSAGKWRLRAYCPADSQHAASWASGYDYVTVKTRGELAVAIAKTYVGTPYQWGGNGPLAFDSSGLVRHVYASMGVWLPRTADQQYAAGPRVSTANLKPGDLVFFYSPISHVGIYVGGGMMIDCNRPGGGVQMHRVYPGLVGATRQVR